MLVMYFVFTGAETKLLYFCLVSMRPWDVLNQLYLKQLSEHWIYQNWVYDLSVVSKWFYMNKILKLIKGIWKTGTSGSKTNFTSC